MKMKTKLVLMVGCLSAALWTTACKEVAEIQSMEVETTGYSHTQESQKKWGLVTASGAPLQATKAHNSAAADWSRFPAGTVFRLSNHPERFVVEDYGSALVGKDVIDIYRSDSESANNWGRQILTIEVLEWGSFERSRDILATRLQVPYCKTMHDAIVAKLDSQ